MKRFIPVYIFILAILSSCNNEVTYNEMTNLTYDNFDLNIDSVYDVTSTSVSIRAKLDIHKYGNVHLSGIFVEIGRTEFASFDSLYRKLDFEKIDKVVTLTIDSLTPNTLYYIKTGGMYNPPLTEINSWPPLLFSITAPSAVSFHTMPY